MHTHPIPTSQHSFKACTSRSPSQQQLENNLNKKTSPSYSQNMGRGAFSSTHPHKEKKQKFYLFNKQTNVP
jgi:hypothetical protein